MSTDPFSLLNATSSLANELKSIESRNNNLMVYSLTDSSSNNNQQALLDDIKLLNDLFKLIDISDITNFSLRRIGKYDENKIRPLCVTLNFQKEVFTIINKARNLPKGVKVSTDKSRLQQRTFKQLMDVLNVHNNIYPDDAFRIKLISNLLDSNNVIRDPKNSIVKLHSQNNK